MHELSTTPFCSRFHNSIVTKQPKYIKKERERGRENKEKEKKKLELIFTLFFSLTKPAKSREWIGSVAE